MGSGAASLAGACESTSMPVYGTPVMFFDAGPRDGARDAKRPLLDASDDEDLPDEADASDASDETDASDEADAPDASDGG